MCTPLPIAYWPSLWWPLWLAGAATAWAQKSSAQTGSPSNKSVRTPLLKLAVSQLALRPNAPLNRRPSAIALRGVSRP